MARTGTNELDTVVRGGTVIDGTGAAGRAADVGIAGGRIVAIDERIETLPISLEAHS